MASANFLALVLLISVGVEVSLSVTQLDLPVARIFQVTSDNRLRPWTRINSNYETTVENVENLRLDCTASYPVQWIYTGNGIPAYTSTNKYSRRNTLGETTTEFTATVEINPLKEAHTGKYQCSPGEFIDGRTFFYIYVPGQNLFTSNTARNIILPKNDTTILIPCTVSHPNMDVTLDKSEGDILRKVRVKSSDAVTYDPKLGFTVKINKVENPEGTYVCTARHGPLVRSLEFKVKSSFNEFPSDQPFANLAKCKKNCGENAYCDVDINNQEICKCLPEFNGDPNLKCVIKCEAHTDCPSTMSCFVDRQCRSPCVHSQVGCGVNAKCRVENHRPVCYCPPDWIGDETIQCFNSLQGSEPSRGSSRPRPGSEALPALRPSPAKPSGSGIPCHSNTECPSNMTCIRTTASNSAKECFDPCLTKHCGRNAECKIEDRKSFCTCLSGFYGDARIECSPEKLREPAFEPLIQAEQPYNPVNSYQPRRCNRPEMCGINSDCRMDKNGNQQCLCQEGYMGQPPKCRPECLQNKDCPGDHICVSDSRVGYPTCAKTCGSRVCGAHADCGEFEDGSFECFCPSGLFGDPLVRCETKEQRLGKDCSADYDCGTKLWCEISADDRKCSDPCDKKRCGPDLVCDSNDHKGQCVCPKGYTGNEYVGCNKDVHVDPSFDTLCGNLTCGAAAECKVNNNGRARCHCKAGYVGKFPACVSECEKNTDCPSDLTCLHKRCRHRCVGCGKNTKCRVAPNADRTSVCYCLEGFEGNPYAAAGCVPFPK